jgi:nucleoside-triphosphatase THEP1
VTRICITGGPRTGKTTLARKLVDEQVDAIWPRVEPVVCRHSDDLIAELAHLGKDAWSEER